MKSFKQMCSEIADHIEKVGWIQGRRYEDWDTNKRNTTPCCIMGAVEVVGNYYEVENFCTDFYAAMGVSYVTAWNDMPGRTKEEVIGTLRRLASE